MQLNKLLWCFMFCFSYPCFAAHDSCYAPFTVDAALGFTSYSGTSNQENITASGRFSLGYTMMTQSFWQIGIESGIQNGANFILDLPKSAIDSLGGVPIEAQLKPVMDVLMSFKIELLNDTALAPIFKAGVAYRQLQTPRLELNELNLFSPEFQLGLGYRLNEQVTFSASYQYILGQTTQIEVNSEKETGHLRYIPSQQGVWFGVTYQF